ncbi:MAG: hypothetical protein SGARI_002254, partial [Bacillariaceae sp.]
MRSWVTRPQPVPTEEDAKQQSAEDDDDSLESLLMPDGSIANRSSEHNLSIRSDASSESSQSSWSADDYLDLKYSLSSNIFFLAGACCQTFVSVWDLLSAIYDSDDDDDDDGVYIYTFSDRAYYFMYTLGPTLYLFNSLVDIRWSMAFLTFPNPFKYCCADTKVAAIATTQDENAPQDTEERSMDGNTASSSSCSRSSSVSGVELEERWWGLVVAIVFGLGAVCEIYSTILDDVYEDADDYDDDSYLVNQASKLKWFLSNYKITAVSMHLYLLSGVIQLISQRKSHRGSHVAFCCNDGGGGGGRSRVHGEPGPGDDSAAKGSVCASPHTFAIWIMMVGTILFVTGTLMDCIISYIYDPQVLNDIDPKQAIVINDVVLA